MKRLTYVLLGLAVVVPAAAAETTEDETTSVVKEIREIRRRLGIEIMHSALWQEENGRDASFDEILRGLVTGQVSQSPVRQPPMPPSREEQFASVLRRASLELDVRAGALELSRHFSDADRLRRLASQLRREARRAESAVPPAIPPL